MARSKYDLMKESEVTDEFGNKYPDLATFPLNTFVTNTKPSNYKLTQMNCMRFFDLIKEYYDSYDFYDSMELWFNDINEIYDEEVNFDKEIKFYGKTDFDDWYIASVRGESVEKERKE